ncbi:hypothetical protein PTSG_07906 [Salpingoeca rosetta]|uniref:Uncharacterized protein n=1 Tax=Salpingoeca rosetta (strain ATCC 50818 / BSB-021) TaxID=946362 RepID=F2UGN8_SALR5|nr:uncharacterized protein PTSG_07906 [Salpingoeca rosetta]EGD75788.1 hypothetical protein PTSG_07906 [Salpingoeca rosetta]|eukprot:XP_004991709.1 hypothetical protein PTSG_07906 [Salpingoeca rosetta]
MTMTTRQALIWTLVAATTLLLATTAGSAEAQGFFHHGPGQRQRSMWPSMFPSSFHESSGGGLFGAPSFARWPSHRHQRQQQPQRQRQRDPAWELQQQRERETRQLNHLLSQRQSLQAERERIDQQEQRIHGELAKADGVWRDLAVQRERLTQQQGGMPRHANWRQMRRLQQEEAYVQRYVRERRYKLEQLASYRAQLGDKDSQLQAAIQQQEAKLDALTTGDNTKHASENGSADGRAQQQQPQSDSAPQGGKFVKRVRVKDGSSIPSTPSTSSTPSFDRTSGYLVDEDGLKWQAGGIWVGEPGGSHDGAASKAATSTDERDSSQELGDAMREIDAFLRQQAR